MKRAVAMTIHDRPDEVIRAVFSSLAFPGNTPDAVYVCYDRAPERCITTVQEECKRLGFELQEALLVDTAQWGHGPRCPSKAWNTVLKMASESHVMCISSDTVLAPHSVGMAYQLTKVCPKDIIIGRAEHSGPSYKWTHTNPTDEQNKITNRMMTWHIGQSPLGFVWLLPMAKVRGVGGYDERYMEGLCYEDADFVIRMWRTGSDFIFCDDVAGFHIEHPRKHLIDGGGRVSVNEELFVKTYGAVDYLSRQQFPHYACTLEVGIGAWLHSERTKLAHELHYCQRAYGYGKSWVGIPTDFEYTDKGVVLDAKTPTSE